MKATLRPGITALPLAILLYVLLASPLRAAGEIEEAFRDALYAEEVKGDLESALKAYQDVGAKFELQRDLAAAALFREGECLRKLGRKEAAVAIYQKVLARYSDKERIAKLSRDNLAALGQAPQTSALPDAPAGLTEEEAKELARLQTLAQNSPDLLGQGNPTPLEDAVAKGRAAVVAWLLDRLPKQTPDTLGRHLAKASSLGHLKICEQLVDAGASINGHGALHSALLWNRLAVARFLLGRGADADDEYEFSANQPTGLAWQTGLRTAAGSSYSFTKTTPLMIAAASSVIGPDVLSELLKAGAKVEKVAVAEEKRSRSGSPGAQPEGAERLTALGGAIAVGSPEKVRLLLEAGADVNQGTSDLGASPLLLALAKTEEKDPATAASPIVKMLVAAGADWKARLSTGATALHIAARRRFDGWVVEAIKAGVDVNAVDNRGFTALHEAARSSSAGIVRALGAAGAKPDVVSTEPRFTVTPLYLACDGPRDASGLDTLKALLEGGADPNLAASPGMRPLYFAVSGSFYSERRWPEAVKLLIDHRARPAEANILAKQQTGGSNLLPDDAALDAFRAAWKAAYWRDNPRLAHAVWLSRSESALKAWQEPSFVAILCDESAAGPPTLREVIGLAEQSADWSKATIIRQKDGSEQVIPVDAIAMATEATPRDFLLEWGDVVEAPLAESQPAAEQAKERLTGWLRSGTRADIRIELDHQRSVANADGMRGPVVRIEGQSLVDLGTVMRTAGLTEMLFVTQGIRRTQRDGTLGAVEQSGMLRHGDILVLSVREPQPKLSDTAMRSGIWLCHTLDGPFWPVPPQQDIFDGEPVPLGGLVAALLGPHPLPSPTFAWEKSTVRFVADEKEWQEKSLLEAWPTLKLQPGTVLILPPAELDSFEPSAEFRETLTKALAIEWNLAVGQQPLITTRWEPRFFRGKTEGGAWVWRDLDSAKVGHPVLPVLHDLLAAHPNAGAFKNGPKDYLAVSTLGGGSDLIDRAKVGRWMSHKVDSLVISVNEPDKPPSPTPPQPIQGLPGRRVILPPPVK
jgi:ankyrin repeat protein